MSQDPSIARLQAALRTFVVERDWEQFHTPKNLVMALAAEVGELVAEYQWQPQATADHGAAADPAMTARVRDEIADVAIYLLRLCDVLDVDLTQVVEAKLQRNEQRFPTDAVAGRAVRGRDMTAEPG